MSRLLESGAKFFAGSVYRSSVFLGQSSEFQSSEAKSSGVRSFDAKSSGIAGSVTFLSAIDFFVGGLLAGGGASGGGVRFEASSGADSAFQFRLGREKVE